MRRVFLLLVVTLFVGCEQQQPVSPSSQQQRPNSVPEQQPGPVPPPGPVKTGDYQITLVAQDCDNLGRSVLPIELRARHYPATVQQNGTDIRVGVVTKSTITHLWGTIDSHGRASLTNYYGNDQWDAIWEFLTPQQFIEILVEDMKVDVLSDGALSTGTFEGYMGTGRHENGNTESSCRSSTHSVMFVRR